MFNFFIDRPIFSTVLSLIITLAGALAWTGLPVSQYPQIVPPQVQVATTFLSNYALLNLQDALARIPGVGLVRIFGARDYSMRIWLDPDKMARLGVTASDIQKVVQEQNVVAPAGRVGVPPVPKGQQMQY